MIHVVAVMTHAVVRVIDAVGAKTRAAEAAIAVAESQSVVDLVEIHT